MTVWLLWQRTWKGKPCFQSKITKKKKKVCIYPCPAEQGYTLPKIANSVDPDELASEEDNWTGSALFVIQYVNLCQQSELSNLTGCQAETVVAVVQIFKATRYPRHAEAAVIVMFMYLYRLAFMDHLCTNGAADCHQAPPCPLYTQPRPCWVRARCTNGLKIVLIWAGFEPTISRLKVLCANY